MKTEAHLLSEIAAAATLREQAALVGELDAMRRAKTVQAQAARDWDAAGTVVEQTLTPVLVHSMHTASTDWLSEADMPGLDANKVHAEASLWFGKTSSMVKADQEEFAEQARGVARRLASQFGESAPEAQRLFLDYVAFLHRREAASGLPQIQQTHDGKDNPSTTPLPEQTFDTFEDPIAPMNQGVDEMQSSENAPLLNEIIQAGQGEGQYEQPNQHSTQSYPSQPPYGGSGMQVGSSLVDAPSVAQGYLYNMDDFRASQAAIQQTAARESSDDSESSPSTGDLSATASSSWCDDCDARMDDKGMCPSCTPDSERNEDERSGQDVNGKHSSKTAGELPDALKANQFGKKDDAEADEDDLQVEAGLPFGKILDKAKDVGKAVVDKAKGNDKPTFTLDKDQVDRMSRTLPVNKAPETPRQADHARENQVKNIVNRPLREQLQDATRKKTAASGLPQVQQVVDNMENPDPKSLPLDVMFPLIPYFQNGMKQTSQKIASSVEEMLTQQGSDNPMLNKTHVGEEKKADEPKNAMEKATHKASLNEYRKAAAFAANWKPGQPIVRQGSAAFEAGLYAGISANGSAQAAWLAEHEKWGATDAGIADRIEMHATFSESLVAEAGTTMDGEEMTAGNGLNSGPYSMNSPINGPGEEPPMAGGMDPAAAGGAAMYNGAEPFSKPVAPDPGWVDPQKRQASFRALVQANLQAQAASEPKNTPVCRGCGEAFENKAVAHEAHGKMGCGTETGERGYEMKRESEAF